MARAPKPNWREPFSVSGPYGEAKEGSMEPDTERLKVSWRLRPVRMFALGSILPAIACGSSGADKTATDGTVTQDKAAFTSLTPIMNDAEHVSPFDSTPDPSGKTVYFTAIGADGAAGVFTSLRRPRGSSPA